MYNDFSSMPPEQEREFVVFEQRSRESSKSAFRTGAIVGAVYGLLMVVVVMSHSKPPPLIAEEDISGSKESRRVNSDFDDEDTAPTPEPAAEAPAAEAAAAEAPAAEAAAAEAAAPVVPAPAAGTTKASPTDLVKANQ